MNPYSKRNLAGIMGTNTSASTELMLVRDGPLMIWGGLRQRTRDEVFSLANRLMSFFFLAGRSMSFFFLDFTRASPRIINGPSLFANCHTDSKKSHFSIFGSASVSNAVGAKSKRTIFTLIAIWTPIYCNT